jgi:serine/threonine-protein kinase ATR
MARRPAVTANAGRADNTAPPQSTLAAQIVRNQTRPASNDQHGEAANIRDLLQDFLHNEATVQETDVNVNAQLVKVLVQAVLARLTTGVLFETGDALHSLASDCIAVIQATVKRQPDVLLVQLDPNEPQLLLSLLSTMIALGGRPKSENFAIRHLFETALASLSTSVASWQYARTLSEVIQDSVDGTFR